MHAPSSRSTYSSILLCLLLHTVLPTPSFCSTYSFILLNVLRHPALLLLNSTTSSCSEYSSILLYTIFYPATPTPTYCPTYSSILLHLLSQPFRFLHASTQRPLMARYHLSSIPSTTPILISGSRFTPVTGSRAAKTLMIDK